MLDKKKCSARRKLNASERRRNASESTECDDVGHIRLETLQVCSTLEKVYFKRASCQPFCVFLSLINPKNRVSLKLNCC